MKTLINKIEDAGYKSITWDGTDAFGQDVGAGMYFYIFEMNGSRKIKKMVLLK